MPLPVTPLTYNVDLVFCIDTSASMLPYIETVKKMVKHWWMDFFCAVEERGALLGKLRVKVILFNNVKEDNYPIEQSEFFTLGTDKTQLEEFYRFIDNGVKVNGNSNSSNALDALSLAMDSKWTNDNVRRHVIITFTNSFFAELKEDQEKIDYQNLPAPLQELTDKWENMQRRAKRMLIFSPDQKPWDYIYCNLESVFQIDIAKISALDNAISIFYGLLFNI